MKKFRLANCKLNNLAALMSIAVAVPFVVGSTDSEALIAATHIYHNHMPNFWPYYDTSTYASTPVGGPVRYAYDGQALNLKLNPPANYKYYLNGGTGAIMPHDDFVTYYGHDAKRNAYTSWPAMTAKANNKAHPMSQTQVTMSAAVITNVQSFAELGSFDFYSLGWAQPWKDTVGSLKTTNGFNALEPIHFTGHHSMGPLVGPKYFLKDLIYQNVVLQQDFFLGDKFKSSKGFFPTELGFSERLIPTLTKLGIEWSVMGNNHFSRALRDYPYKASNPAYDTLVSPPNRADLQNTFEKGGWENIGMAHEQQLIVNKFPFASTPHWVQYVDPETAEVSKIAGIPVDQNGSWQEGWDGSAVPADSNLPQYEGIYDRPQYFVIAHDGDNSQGRAGSISTWMASGEEYSTSGVVGMGVQEYLKAYPIPSDDIQHIQDGSWVDTRDSSSDPDWYHWHIPMGVWKAQFPEFNKALGTDFEVPKNHKDTPFGHAVSLEYGYHYLERNFALLQAAINYAETAEQIWLDSHPNYWSPKTASEKEVTYIGNQLNPYMFSFPVKGDEKNDYQGGANPAELGWYFLISSIDSGFGYYDENKDDNVKPTLSFNQSLFFTEPYVSANIMKDKTGPSMWWVQRYPTNPGSANSGKAEGWTPIYADNTWAVYTYAYDVSGIKSVKVYVRAHKDKRMSPTDIAPRVYEPKKFAGQPNVDVNQVGEWKVYETKMRDLEKDINGVAWQTYAEAKNYDVLPAKKIGNTYFAYISDYRDQLVDYYMEAIDNNGNVTRSEINHTYVGAGRYDPDTFEENVNGQMEGTHMFFSDGTVVLKDKVTVYAKTGDNSVGAVYVHYKDKGASDWNSVEATRVSSENDYFKTTVEYTRDATCADIKFISGGSSKAVPSDVGSCLSKGVYTINNDGTITEGAPSDIVQTGTVYFKPSKSLSKACFHYRGTPDAKGTGWTKAPGVEMAVEKNGWFSSTAQFEANITGMEFLFNDCGSNWFKTSSGGNFTTNSVGVFNVDGTKLTAGCPTDASDKCSSNPPVNISPVARIVANPSSSVKKGTSVTLDGSTSSDSDGTIASYKWSTGATTAKITVTPTETTTYTLVVTDDKGATNTTSYKVVVDSDIVLQVEPSFEDTSDNKTVKFSNTSTVSSNAETVVYEWDFGDGSKSSEKSPTHTYANAGNYKVVLSVTAKSGSESKTEKFSKVVAITSGVDLIASYRLNEKSNLYVSFKNTTTVSGSTKVSYEWDFGDGQTSTDTDAYHTYAEEGTYTVVLTAKSDSKISVSKMQVTVSLDEVAVFNAVALRSSENSYQPEDFVINAGSKNLWIIENYTFSKKYNTFKIEGFNGVQCVIVGGKVNERLTADGEYINVEAGTYDIHFDAESMVVTLIKK
ncbi:MAG: PKD domain-containing protein [Succinivibrionaceae bacterium]